MSLSQCKSTCPAPAQPLAFSPIVRRCTTNSSSPATPQEDEEENPLRDPWVRIVSYVGRAKIIILGSAVRSAAHDYWRDGMAQLKDGNVLELLGEMEDVQYLFVQSCLEHAAKNMMHKQTGESGLLKSGRPIKARRPLNHT